MSWDKNTGIKIRILTFRKKLTTWETKQVSRIITFENRVTILEM